MSIWQNQYDFTLGADTAIGAVLGDEPAGLGIDFLSLKTIIRDNTGAYLFQDLFDYADQPAMEAAGWTVSEPGGAGNVTVGGGQVFLTHVGSASNINRLISVPVGVYDIYVDIIAETTASAAQALVRGGVSALAVTYANIGLYTANPGVWQAAGTVVVTATQFLTLQVTGSGVSMTFGGLRLVRKDLGTSGVSTVPTLLTYTSPSPKYVHDYQGMMVSDSTLRCDHDPATYSGSSVEFSTAGVGTGQPVRMSTVLDIDYAFQPGQDVRFTNAANTAQWMLARVVSKVGSTLTFDAYDCSGVFSAFIWHIIVANGLLVENARVNSALWSQEFDNAAWVKVGCTITANNTTAPDGTMTADKVVFSSSASVKQTITASTTTIPYVFSVWARSEAASATATIVLRKVGTGDADSTLAINLTNRWQRFQIYWGANATFTAVIVGLENISANIFMWGAQLEIVTIPSGVTRLATSYILTTTAPVTRAADQITLSLTNLSWDQQTAAVMVDFTTNYGTVSTNGQYFPVYLYLNSTNYAYVMVDTTSSRWGMPALRMRAGGGVSLLDGSDILLGVSGFRERWAFAYSGALNLMRFVRNGAKQGSDASTPLPDPPMLTTIGFGYSILGVTNHINGHLRRMSSVPRFKTDAELVIDTSGVL